MNDRTKGKILLTVSCIFFSYYTAWVILLPFSDPDHAVNQLFPPVRYALMIPVLMGLAFIGGLVLFTVYHIRCASVSSE